MSAIYRRGSIPVKSLGILGSALKSKKCVGVACPSGGHRTSEARHALLRIDYADPSFSVGFGGA